MSYKQIFIDLNNLQIPISNRRLMLRKISTNKLEEYLIEIIEQKEYNTYYGGSKKSLLKYPNAHRLIMDEIQCREHQNINIPKQKELVEVKKVITHEERELKYLRDKKEQKKKKLISEKRMNTIKCKRQVTEISNILDSNVKDSVQIINLIKRCLD